MREAKLICITLWEGVDMSARNLHNKEVRTLAWRGLSIQLCGYTGNVNANYLSIGERKTAFSRCKDMYYTNF